MFFKKSVHVEGGISVDMGFFTFELKTSTEFAQDHWNEINEEFPQNGDSIDEPGGCDKIRNDTQCCRSQDGKKTEHFGSPCIPGNFNDGSILCQSASFIKKSGQASKVRHCHAKDASGYYGSGFEPGERLSGKQRFDTNEKSLCSLMKRWSFVDVKACQPSGGQHVWEFFFLDPLTSGQVNTLSKGSVKGYTVAYGQLVSGSTITLATSFSKFLMPLEAIVDTWNQDDSTVVSAKLTKENWYALSMPVIIPSESSVRMADGIFQAQVKEFVLDVVAFHKYFVDMEQMAYKVHQDAWQAEPLRNWCRNKNSFCANSASGVATSLDGCFQECAQNSECSAFAFQDGDSGDDGIHCYLYTKSRACQMGDASSWGGGYVTLYCRPTISNPSGGCAICPKPLRDHDL